MSKTVITKENIDQFVISGEWDIGFSVKPDKDSKESKSGILRFMLDQVSVKDVIQSSLKDKRINVQVGLRTKFDQVVDKAVRLIDYVGGRGPAADPEAVMAAKLKLMDNEARIKYIESLLAKDKG